MNSGATPTLLMYPIKYLNEPILMTHLNKPLLDINIFLTSTLSTSIRCLRV